MNSKQNTKLCPEYVYKLALKALSEVDVADIACRMNEACEHFEDHMDMKFSNEFDLSADIEPKNVTKALYLILKEAVKRYYDSSDGSDCEVCISGIYVNIDDYGISIQYRPVDLYVTGDDLDNDEDDDE